MKAQEYRIVRKQLIFFFGTAFLLSWSLWLLPLMVQDAAFVKHLREPLLALGTFGPSIAGITLARRFDGKGEGKRMLKSLICLRIKPVCGMYLLFVPILISAVSCTILKLFGVDLPEMGFPIWFLPISFIYILILMGPLGEEAGWRGFALKRLLRRHTPMLAAVVLGIVWFLWHLPLFFVPKTVQNGLLVFGLIPTLLGYLSYTLMISILMTLLFTLSDGCLLGCVLFHAIANFSLGVVPFVFVRAGAGMLLLVLCVVTAALILRHKTILLQNAQDDMPLPSKEESND